MTAPEKGTPPAADRGPDDESSRQLAATSAPSIPANSHTLDMWLSATLHGHPPRVCDLIAAGHAIHEGLPVNRGWLAAQLWDLADLLTRGGGHHG